MSYCYSNRNRKLTLIMASGGLVLVFLLIVATFGSTIGLRKTRGRGLTSTVSPERQIHPDKELQLVHLVCAFLYTCLYETQKPERVLGTPRKIRQQPLEKLNPEVSGFRYRSTILPQASQSGNHKIRESVSPVSCEKPMDMYP